VVLTGKIAGGAGEIFGGKGGGGGGLGPRAGWGDGGEGKLHGMRVPQRWRAAWGFSADIECVEAAGLAIARGDSSCERQMRGFFAFDLE
jgi:hypothetical protein